MLAIRTILHPTDFSEQSASAFHLAWSLARDHGARLVVLHVYPPPVAHGELVARRQPNGFHEQLWEQMHRLQAPEGVGVDYRLEEGDAADQIVLTARRLDCDLVVMGTHGRSGVSRLLMGSAAEQVLRRSPCPVLTVNGVVPLKAPKDEAPTGAAAPV
jgi:nucleotide-binding universal stress UspA family protein